jgi:hypothetical protein
MSLSCWRLPTARFSYLRSESSEHSKTTETLWQDLNPATRTDWGWAAIAVWKRFPWFKGRKLLSIEKMSSGSEYKSLPRIENVQQIKKSPKACESGRSSAEYDNLGVNPDTKSCTKILWDFVWRIARNGGSMNLIPGWSDLIQQLLIFAVRPLKKLSFLRRRMGWGENPEGIGRLARS